MAPGIALNPELLQLRLGLNRIMTYIGYVLLADTFVFWSLVCLEGRTDRRLVTLAAIGTGLMVVATIGAPLILVSFGDRLVATQYHWSAEPQRSSGWPSWLASHSSWWI